LYKLLSKTEFLTAKKIIVIFYDLLINCADKQTIVKEMLQNILKI